MKLSLFYEVINTLSLCLTPDALPPDYKIAITSDNAAVGEQGVYQRTVHRVMEGDVLFWILTDLSRSGTQLSKFMEFAD